MCHKNRKRGGARVKIDCLIACTVSGSAVHGMIMAIHTDRDSCVGVANTRETFRNHLVHIDKQRHFGHCVTLVSAHRPHFPKTESPFRIMTSVLPNKQEFARGTQSV
ncbi:hypothetical protein BaRGS_00018930 [Batillaria attramentaria]|uniref:Uncharacterized protein n=1 Tax=Batillaria attramentaria TaxID=370345 RepID=A0ABD0KRK5_9CAEN